MAANNGEKKGKFLSRLKKKRSEDSANKTSDTNAKTLEKKEKRSFFSRFKKDKNNEASKKKEKPLKSTLKNTKDEDKKEITTSKIQETTGNNIENMKKSEDDSNKNERKSENGSYISASLQSALPISQKSIDSVSKYDEDSIVSLESHVENLNLNKNQTIKTNNTRLHQNQLVQDHLTEEDLIKLRKLKSESYWDKLTLEDIRRLKEFNQSETEHKFQMMPTIAPMGTFISPTMPSVLTYFEPPQLLFANLTIPNVNPITYFEINELNRMHFVNNVVFSTLRNSSQY